MVGPVEYFVRIFVYIDNIIIYGKTMEEHDQHLTQLLTRARENEIRFHAKKSTTKTNSSEVFLAYIFKGRKTTLVIIRHQQHIMPRHHNHYEKNDKTHQTKIRKQQQNKTGLSMSK